MNRGLLPCFCNWPYSTFGMGSTCSLNWLSLSASVGIPVFYRDILNTGTLLFFLYQYTALILGDTKKDFGRDQIFASLSLASHCIHLFSSQL